LGPFVKYEENEVLLIQPIWWYSIKMIFISAKFLPVKNGGWIGTFDLKILSRVITTVLSLMNRHLQNFQNNITIICVGGLSNNLKSLNLGIPTQIIIAVSSYENM
jgi:hypothetical protein